MKRLLPLAAVALLAGFASYGCSDQGGADTTGVSTFTPQFGTEANPDVYDLWAGRNTDVGDVKVWNDGSTLYVRYEMDDDLCITETHLHIATDVAGIPQTKKGNPIPGQFDYGEEGLACVSQWPESGWFMTALPGATAVYIAAHAKVLERTHVLSGETGDGSDLKTIVTKRR